jgi:NitT/TauT family transport system ATP-binding protein
VSSKIELAKVSHSYQRGRELIAAFEDLSLSIAPGEFVSIVGPSGCGKTTLLFSVAGFIQPLRGRILVDGKPVSGPGRDRGIVFQSFALFNWLTVRENVEFGPRMRGVPSSERRKRSDNLLAMVGLSRFGERYPYELSGGMKQRTAITRALANDPDILLMDEPFGALDAQSREMMQEELVRIWETTRKTVLFVTHSIDVHLPEPRYDPHIRTSPEFIASKDSILDLVREETIKQFSEEASA